jgi:membrane AbrB-like protein
MAPNIYLLAGTVLAFLMGLALAKLKIPGGMLICGAVVISAISLRAGSIELPSQTALAAQICSGAVIGCNVESRIVRELPSVALPAVILISSLLVSNIAIGCAIAALSPLDLLTGLLASIPGGVTNVAIISADTPADTPKVATLQFIRMISGIVLFPLLIRAAMFFLRERQSSAGGGASGAMRAESATIQGAAHAGPGILEPKTGPQRFRGLREMIRKGLPRMALTLLLAAVGGILVSLTHIPAGGMIGSMLSVFCARLARADIFLPRNARFISQLMAGILIGSGMTARDFGEITQVAVPAAIIVSGYFANCLIVAFILNRFAKFPFIDAMLAATPSGGSEMALISMDMGIFNPHIAALQIVRLLTSIAVFPSIMFVVCGLAA